MSDIGERYVNHLCHGGLEACSCRIRELEARLKQLENAARRQELEIEITQLRNLLDEKTKELEKLQ